MIRSSLRSASKLPKQRWLLHRNESTLAAASASASVAETLHSSGKLSALSDLFLQLPDLLPAQPSYTVSIVALCLVLRFGVTLPVAIWQRKRTDRLHKIVGPQMREWALKERHELRKRFRPAGKTYEEYQAEFNRLVKEKQKALQKEYKCSPRLTVFLPLAVYLPVFLGATMAIREACYRASIFKNHVISAAVSSRSAGIESGQLPGLEGIDGAEKASMAKHLLELANERLTESLSLIETDPNLILPIAVGIALSLNVELSASVRAAYTAAREADATKQIVAPGPPTHTLKPASPAPRQAKPLKNGKRRYATQAPEAATAKSALSRSSGLITNILRVMGVGMIIVATQNPVAVNLYWIVSNTFTLIQNSIFALLDRRNGP